MPRGALAGVTIAFDLDGTLVDTAPDLIGALNVVLAEAGHAGMPVEAARVLVGHGARVMLTRGFAAAGETLSPERLDQFYARFIALYRPRIALESRPFPGAEAALEALAAEGAALSVCTNKPTALSVALLTELGLIDRFAAVLGPDAAGAAKPDPRLFYAAVERAGGEATRALMVGDSRTDLETARAAGAPAAIVTWGYSDAPPAELGADALIDRFAELPAAARRLLEAHAV
jgi:phosphoglycolate phosphatase